MQGTPSESPEGHRAQPQSSRCRQCVHNVEQVPTSLRQQAHFNTWAHESRDGRATVRVGTTSSINHVASQALALSAPTQPPFQQPGGDYSLRDS
jgi:hypothetical protein